MHKQACAGSSILAPATGAVQVAEYKKTHLIRGNIDTEDSS